MSTCRKSRTLLCWPYARMASLLLVGSLLVWLSLFSMPQENLNSIDLSSILKFKCYLTFTAYTYQLYVAFVNTVTTNILGQATCNSYRYTCLKGEQQQGFCGVVRLVTVKSPLAKSVNDSAATGQGAESLHEISKRNRGINTSAP